MDETKPLLSMRENPGERDAIPTAPLLEEPPPYSEEPATPAPYIRGGATPPSLSTSPEHPPPYSFSSDTPSTIPGQTLFVQCRVCQHVIHVAPGTRTRVVKCSNCREATPIAPPPPGKKYVRCPCNCLLTCSASAARVVCPRENCKRMIGVGTIDVRPMSSNRIRVTCGRCRRSILWPANAAVARCPHCQKRSYLYASWMRYRAISLIASGVLLLVIAAALTGGTYAWALKHGGIYVVWVGLFIVGFLLLVRAAFYCNMTQSNVEY